MLPLRVDIVDPGLRSGAAGVELDMGVLFFIPLRGDLGGVFDLIREAVGDVFGQLSLSDPCG